MTSALDRLLAGVQRGDVDAFARLYDQLGVAVYRLALQLTSSPTRAEDVTINVFLAAWAKPESLVVHRERLQEHLLHRCYVAVADTIERDEPASW